MLTAKLVLKIKAFHPYYLQTFYTNLLKNQHLIISCKQIYLPQKRELFTLLKSPHVDKKARDQFERKTYKRLLILSFTTASNMELQMLNKVLAFLKTIAVGVEITALINKKYV